MSMRLKVIGKVVSGLLLIAMVLVGTISVKGAENSIKRMDANKQLITNNSEIKTKSNNNLTADNIITIEPRKIYKGYQDDSSGIKLYQITMKSSGTMSVTITPQNNTKMNSVKLQILDSNKETLGVETLHYTNYVNGVYGSVSKKLILSEGTYYIQVNTSCGAYDITYTSTRMIDIAGSSKENAMPIAVGGIGVKGFCTVSDSLEDVDWFQFTISKYKELDIKVITKTEGALKFELCNSNGEIYGGAKELRGTHFGIGKALPKGTYYIKIYKDRMDSSGTYSIKISETSLFK